ncbi:F0F1 ATP synthase subunit delta [Salimicrobium halophilum]|uniref:ATP synthase subunit delta n=1 Tax=Salimicrobium halophilum TaxID=86666 RepID=A0A1G8SGG5_9BACI|nr:F0F1 ATP synthase subunit delta [Salimicrobium halophilum]SDJ28318.1 ATP synthase F1 subcomplex delta subunit [Salimicrobium halophilum]
MSEVVVAKRYADALFELGQEKSKLDTFQEEMKTLRKVALENGSLETVLKHPRIPADRKKELVNESFKGFSEEVLHTLHLLIDRHRTEIIIPLAERFLAKVNEHHGVQEATVYTVRELSEEEKQRLSKTFAPKVGKDSLIIDNRVDPDLLGGVRIRIGNRIFDGSVRGKLDQMERELLSANNRG